MTNHIIRPCRRPVFFYRSATFRTFQNPRGLPRIYGTNIVLEKRSGGNYCSAYCPVSKITPPSCTKTCRVYRLDHENNIFSQGWSESRTERSVFSLKHAIFPTHVHRLYRSSRGIRSAFQTRYFTFNFPSFFYENYRKFALPIV